MKLSIITPSFNQGLYIEKNILSVLNQNWHDVEHIIIDGGSTDDTLSVLRKYPHLIWVSEPDEGQADALNKGLKIATGNIIGWINSDDYYEKDVFKSIVDAFEKDKYIDWIVGRIIHIYPSLGIEFFSCYNKISYDSLINNPDILTQQGAFYRKKAIERVNGWNRKYYMVMDLDLWVKLSKCNAPKMIFEHLAYFTHHNQQKSLPRNYAVQLSEIIDILKKEKVSFFIIAKISLKKFLYIFKAFFKAFFIYLKIINENFATVPLSVTKYSISKKRVSVLIYEDNFGGAERSLSDLAAALDQNCFDMRFYYLSGNPGHFAKQIEQFGYKTYFLNWKNGFDILGRIRLIKELKKFNPDVIHDHIIPPLTRLWLKMFIRKPIINTEHGNALQRSLGIGKRWRIFIEKLDFMFCDCIAANSKSSVDALKKTYKISESEIELVYLGINIDLFKPNIIEKCKKNTFKIGYVGRIVNQHKGVDYLPAIAQYLVASSDMSFQIVVAGDGPDREVVEQLCVKMEVEQYFTFLGWIQNVQNFLDSIDILLIPSRYEPLGLTAIEALAMNVPVVAFDVGGLSEILIDCPLGTLVKLGDTKAMADAVYSFYKRRPYVGNAGREFVLEHFSNERMARRYEELYMRKYCVH